MGCENAVMRLILEISMLGEKKSRSEASGTMNSLEIRGRAADIEKRLEMSLATVSENLDGPTEMEVYTRSTITSSDKPGYMVKVITQIFASAAFVYLHVIVSGPHPDEPEILQAVSRTMGALDALENKDLVRNLLWPVCIAGCMAMPEHETYWRELVSNVSQDRWSFGYPAKVLEIMEECWALRRSKLQSGTWAAVDWLTAMKSRDMRVLLV